MLLSFLHPCSLSNTFHNISRVLVTAASLMLLNACGTKNVPSNVDSFSNELLNEQASSLQASLVIPVDKNIHKATLSNGLSYIVRANKRAENYAELRLVVKAGSIQEDEAQLGFAHFVEHMAFNGTQDFKKREIIEFVESIGMQFGAHLNAYTSFNETVYKLRIPLGQKGALETGIHILENWAHKISFEAQDIDDERGVVLEEWRSRKGAQDRIREQTFPILMNGSDYAQRLPIGTDSNITNGTHSDLKRFYDTWYRPDLMTVIVVGDFSQSINTQPSFEGSLAKGDESNPSVRSVSQLIERYYSTIKAPEPGSMLPEKRMQAQTLTKYTKPAIKIVGDKDLSATSFYITWRQPEFKINNVADIRQQIIHNLLLGSINVRFNEASWKTDTPYTHASVNFSRNYDLGFQFTLGVGSKPLQLAASVQHSLLMLQQVKERGITPNELAEQSKIFIDGLNKALSQQPSYQHAGYIQHYKEYVLFEEPVSLASLSFYVEQAKRILPTITANELQEKLNTWLANDDAVLVASMPESEVDDAPSQSDLLNIYTASGQATPPPYTPPKQVLKLMTTSPEAGKVINKTYIEKWDAHLWELSNGAKVYLKASKFEENNIRFSAYSPGGYAKFDDDTYLRSFGMMGAISAMGLGELDTPTYNQYSRDKRFRFSSYISTYSEGASGSTTKEELLPFMQTLHLNFVAPRKDYEIFDWLKGLYKPQIEKRYNNPNALFSSKIREVTRAGNPRDVEFDLAMLAHQDLDTIYDIRKQSFENAADFTFVFVGDFEFDDMERMLNTYVASLPSNENTDSLKLLPDYDAQGDFTITLAKGKEAKATVRMNMWGDASWSPKEQLVFNTLKSSLENRLMIRLREELAGVYGVSVGGGFSQWPYQENNILVAFTCDPMRIDELKDEVKAIFAEFMAGEIDPQSIENSKTRMLTERQKRLKENGFWLYRLLSEVQPYQSVPLSEYSTLVESITLDDVHKAAKRYLNRENKYLATLVPEEFE
ncbi:M16 family metallopeptidase [Glaciecola sp. 2405UD65-10]|uniref:M16 family metallopeptidase n=1 Tax=Glaciecola sp. 2405UD65-10 TaxID=3397244 RepID=UPI003B592BB2